MYIVEKRYEHWSPTGKVWTKWFEAGKAETDSEAEQLKADLTKRASDIAKSVGLKNEFRIVKI